MWFGPPEHNTLLPQGESCIAMCMSLFKAELNLRKVDVFSLKICSCMVLL
jgi:hypothetical protein